MTDYNTIESYASDATEAARSALNEAESLESILTSGEVEEALDLLAEYTQYFDECPADLHEKVEAAHEWEREFPYDDAYSVKESIEELEDFRALGELDDVRAAVEEGCGEDLKAKVEELESTCERQAALIARLATALDEIDTITTDELIGTGVKQ